MSTNDLILLNQLLDQRISEIGEGLSESEYFDIFSAEQILKDDDLSYDELESGVIDGGGDGGIDSIYFFVNNVLYNEDTDLSLLKRNISLRLVILQSTISSGFSEDAIEKMISSARDLFDLNRNLKYFSSVYNDKLIKKVDEFRKTYLNLTSRFPSLTFKYAYAAKAQEVHPNVGRKVQALKDTVEGLFTPISFSFDFFGASELLERARKSPSTTSSLRLAENPISTGEEGFVCLVALHNYLEFITYENGDLRLHLLEGNVRDYQGNTEVNKEIRQSLDSPRGEDFWWLNNGVSIICSKATLSGKTLTIEDAEVVNGLQTSREIYHALKGQDISKESRNLLVRVLKPQDDEGRDRIIKATNSQTPIPPASLRATDKIHRDIEEYLYPKGYYYDRRKNYYKNIGKPIKRIVSIPFMAQSVMACALTNPANARARPSSLIKNDDAYRKIFNSQYPLNLFYICPVIARKVEEALKRSDREEYHKHHNNIKFYVAMLTVLRKIGLPSLNIQDVAGIDASTIDSEFILSTANEVYMNYNNLGGTDRVAKGKDLQSELLELHSKKASI